MTTETTNKKIQEERFEFILYINDKIICQRYFNIRDYNEEIINSYEMKELLDNIAGGSFQTHSLGLIPNNLKNKTIDYLWDNFNPYVKQEVEDIKQNTDKVDNYQFEIKVDKMTVGKAIFSGNMFAPKVRYSVDIKELIPAIMSEIRHYFSQKKYTKVTNSKGELNIYNN
jgi:hypothetical protein